MWASSKGHTAIAQALIGAGADINLRNMVLARILYFMLFHILPVQIAINLFFVDYCERKCGRRLCAIVAMLSTAALLF
jgi:hypothetical protein